MFILLFAACEEEINLHGDAKSLPVVYCLLDVNDSVQYVRVSRSYLYPEEMGLVKPDADSMVIRDDFEIYIEYIENGQMVDLYVFSEVTDFVKDTGFFPAQGQRVYQSDFKVKQGGRYALYLCFKDRPTILYGDIIAVDPVKLIDPLMIPARKITLSEEQHLTVRWLVGEHAGLYQAQFGFNYLEEIADNQVSKRLAIDLPIKYSDIQNLVLTQKLNGHHFLSTLADQIEINPLAIRIPISFDFTMVYMGYEMNLYVRPDTEVSSAIPAPLDFSNIYNSLGVFSSFGILQSQNLELSVLTIDTIAHGQITKNLSFLDSGQID